jgi:predicted RNase H-like HicB family nuclease
MRKFVIPVEVEPLEEGGYLAICQLIQGCHAEGETVAEALDNLEDVARVIMELCMEEGLPLPPELAGTREIPIVKAEVVVR